MEEYQLRDDVRGVEISPVTSADTVYVSDRRLPNIIGNLSSLTTTDKSNLVNAINEAAQGGGGGGSEWEMLIDDTTTADIAQWQFSQGKDGQVFDDYKELLIDLILQQNSGGSTDTTVMRVGFDGNMAWTGTNRYNIGNVGRTDNKTRYTTAIFKKTPVGIVGYYVSTSGSSAYASATYTMGVSGASIINGYLASNQIHPSTEFNLIASEFRNVAVGSYKAGIIGIDSRIRIYGKK